MKVLTALVVGFLFILFVPSCGIGVCTHVPVSVKSGCVCCGGNEVIAVAGRGAAG